MGSASIKLGTVRQVLPHVVFYNLTNAGSSAIVPILTEILEKHFGYVIRDNPGESHNFEADFNPNVPTFQWTHSQAGMFEPFLQRDDFRFICLYRDPRDVLVSHVKDAIHQGLREGRTEAQVQLGYIVGNFDGMYHDADEWLRLKQPNIFTLSFEEMKMDIPTAVRSVLQSLGLSVPEPELLEVCEKHSFEAITGRKCGEDGPTIRNAYMFRKGISGDWKNQFNDVVKEAFHKHFDRFLQDWGYVETPSEEEPTRGFNLVAAPMPSGVAWLTNVLLKLEVKCTSPAPDWGDEQWQATGSDSFQMHPKAHKPLRWHLPSVDRGEESRFREAIDINWGHRLDFAKESQRPTILFTRDGRDAVYSHYRRDYATHESFEDFLNRPDTWPDHFPGMFNLPPAETWGLFNLFWLELAKVTPLHIVRFEDCKADPVKTVEEALNFLGINRTREAIEQAVASSSFEKPQGNEDGLEGNGGKSALLINRRGQPYEWREHYNEKQLAAFNGIANEALGRLGYDLVEPLSPNTDSPVGCLAQTNEKVRQAMGRGALPEACGLLGKCSSHSKTNGELLSIRAEQQAIMWTYRIFGNEHCRSRAALHSQHCFSQALQLHLKSDPVGTLLAENLYGQPRIIKLKPYRGYSLVELGGNFMAFSPVLGPNFRLEDNLSHPTLQKLVEEGKCVFEPQEPKLKTAIDKLLEGISDNIRQLARNGQVDDAIRVLKTCIALTGAKDSATLQLADELTSNFTQKTEPKPQVRALN